MWNMAGPGCVACCGGFGVALHVFDGPDGIESISWHVAREGGRQRMEVCRVFVYCGAPLLPKGQGGLVVGHVCAISVLLKALQTALRALELLACHGVRPFCVGGFSRAEWWQKLLKANPMTCQGPAVHLTAMPEWAWCCGPCLLAGQQCVCMPCIQCGCLLFWPTLLVAGCTVV